MGGCGRSITVPFCHSFLLPLFPAPVWVLPQTAVLQDKPTPAWAPLHRETFLLGGPAPSGASRDCSFLHVIPTCSGMRSSMDSHANICSAMVSPCIRGISALVLTAPSCSHLGIHSTGSHMFFPSLLTAWAGFGPFLLK